MTATGPKGVKFLGQGEYAVAFAVNLPARAKDQCGSPAEARAESFRRFANAEGNSTPGRVRRAPPRAGEAAAAWGERQTSTDDVLAAAAAGSAPPGAPPPDMSDDRFAPMPADLAAKGPTRSDLEVAGLSLEDSSSGQGLPPAITERFTPPLPDGTPGSSRLRPPHAGSSGNSQEPSQEEDSSPDPSPERTGIPMRRVISDPQGRSFDLLDGSSDLRTTDAAAATKPYAGTRPGHGASLSWLCAQPHSSSLAPPSTGTAPASTSRRRRRAFGLEQGCESRVPSLFSRPAAPSLYRRALRPRGRTWSAARRRTWTARRTSATLRRRRGRCLGRRRRWATPLHSPGASRRGSGCR